MKMAMDVRSWLRLSTIALGLTLAAALPVRGQSTVILQESLRLAVCLNDWDSAIARARQLEQVPDIAIKTRAELVLLRRQMQLLRQDQTTVDNISGCESVLAGFGIPGYTGRPLAIERALANAGLSEPLIVPDIVLRRDEALWQAGLGVTADTSLVPLSAAQRISTRTGSGVSTGSVSRRIDIYAFLGAEGDRTNLTLDVIEQRPGLLYTDDRALLFVFDAAGRLLSEARTTPAGQSQLEALALPAAGVYYVAVTTPEHRPVLDDNGVITGWQGIGVSAIDYTLTVTGLTPAPQLGTQP
ncbi:hypothetical protein IQ254_05445 [Nodosilinea sp. LEGE 07088]|uniref:hypothetical protein n=1 Tax=Nodosilinea sp. LEGE 07088 TaxID=2777968 RepID=UPI00187F5D35|nr:hypothetical protein [Nodosilinea sp. LEGE 07088]MBE9136650.1 hypothetical protein [Nodosilinea sp. LEGE 07088]